MFFDEEQPAESIRDLGNDVEIGFFHKAFHHSHQKRYCPTGN